MSLFPSVRARLTAWNVGVVACVLIVSGFTVRYLLREALMRTLDQDLERQSQFWAACYANAPWIGPPRGPATPRPAGSPSANGANPFRPRLLNWRGEDFWRQRPWNQEAFELSLRGERVYRTITVDGQELRLLSLPGMRRGRVQGAIQIVAPLAANQRALDELSRILVILIPVALGLAALGGAFLTARVLQPIRKITRTASRIESQDLSARVPIEGKDEFAELAGVLNGMLGRLEQDFERQKRFAGDASHELRTPLATIKAHSSLALADRWGRDECLRAMAAIEEAADRAGRIVEDLLLLARADDHRLALRAEPHRIGEIVEEAFRQAVGARPPAPREARVVLRAPEPADLAVLGDGPHLVRLFRNLLENALRHTPGGQVTVTAHGGPAWVTVVVADTGEGIAPEHLPHLGQRFYRADAARDRSRGGFGLGLAICRAIVAAHQGRLQFSSELGYGTTVTVTLPRALLDTPLNAFPVASEAR